jgi:hypothetical protein
MINSFYTQKAETNFGFTLRASASFSQASGTALVRREKFI